MSGKFRSLLLVSTDERLPEDRDEPFIIEMRLHQLCCGGPVGDMVVYFSGDGEVVRECQTCGASWQEDMIGHVDDGSDFGDDESPLLTLKGPAHAVVAMVSTDPPIATNDEEEEE